MGSGEVEADLRRQEYNQIKKDVEDEVTDEVDFALREWKYARLKGGIMSGEFVVKDSGERIKFDSGMVRDTGKGKERYNRVLEGPMFQRWARHLTKGAEKYKDVKPGVANWTLADGNQELQRFKESALGHMVDWLNGKDDEDHAAAVFFNINGAEFVKGKLNASKSYRKEVS